MLDHRSITVATTIAPVKTAGPSLAELVATEHALRAGRALNQIEDNKLVGRGGWAAIYKKCGIGEWQAERYKQFARLAAANPSCRTDLEGLSIQDAIKKLSPRKTRQSQATAHQTPSTQPSSTETTHTDIIAAWVSAPQSERVQAVDAIGLVAWLDAVPPERIPQLEQLLAERRQPVIDIVPAESAQAPDLSVPADLSIPPFTRRTPDAEVGGNNEPH